MGRVKGRGTVRVAFISGCIEYSVCLANALSKRSEIDFFYSGAYARQRDETILTLLDSAIGRYEINPYRLRDPRNITSHRRLAERFNGYDVIHMQGSNFWFSLNRQVCRKVPIVCTIHDPVQHAGIPLANRVFQSLAQRISTSQASLFIVHGDKLKATLAALHRIPERRIFVIPHGEFSFYRRFSRGACDATNPSGFSKRILFFGEIRKNKGLEYLIRAEPLISALFNDYSICVAGRFNNEPGNNLAYYRALMRNPGRFEIIDRFIGNHEVAGIFEQSDIVVLPYVSASQSGILALAFGFGKPVVATDTGSIGEMVEHGRTGLLVPPADERLLANALLELLRDDEKCSRFGRNAAALAQGQLNWDIIAEQNLEVYEKAMAQYGKRG
jgi:glycosyltransferase involved in cell wall biosynthesis